MWPMPKHPWNNTNSDTGTAHSSKAHTNSNTSELMYPDGLMHVDRLGFNSIRMTDFEVGRLAQSYGNLDTHSNTCNVHCL